MTDYTLQKFIVDGLHEIGEVKYGEATGGSTTTVIDTNFMPVAVINGTVFIIHDDGDAGAAPEGEWAPITGFDKSAKTITVVDAFSIAVADGDKYAVAGKQFNLPTCIKQANRALQKLGRIGIEDTSITTVNSQTEYTLPRAAARDLRQIWVQGNLNDANDNQWQAVPEWRIEPNAPGVDPVIILPQYGAGRTIKLIYVGRHPKVDAPSDVLQQSVHEELYIAAFAYVTRNLQTNYRQNAEETSRAGYNKAARDWDDAKKDFAIELPTRQSQMLKIRRRR